MSLWQERRSSRKAFDEPIIVWPAGQSSEITARAENLSKHGVAMRAPQAWESGWRVGEEVFCRLPLGPVSTTLAGRVAWVRADKGPFALASDAPTEAAAVRVGVEFDCEALKPRPTTDEVNTKGDAADCRVAVHFAHAGQSICAESVQTRVGITLRTSLPFLARGECFTVSSDAGELDSDALYRIDDVSLELDAENQTPWLKFHGMALHHNVAVEPAAAEPIVSEEVTSAPAFADSGFGAEELSDGPSRQVTLAECPLEEPVDASFEHVRSAAPVHKSYTPAAGMKFGLYRRVGYLLSGVIVVAALMYVLSAPNSTTAPQAGRVEPMRVAAVSGQPPKMQTPQTNLRTPVSKSPATPPAASKAVQPNHAVAAEPQTTQPKAPSAVRSIDMTPKKEPPPTRPIVARQAGGVTVSIPLSPTRPKGTPLEHYELTEPIGVAVNLGQAAPSLAAGLYKYDDPRVTMVWVRQLETGYQVRVFVADKVPPHRVELTDDLLKVSFDDAV